MTRKDKQSAVGKQLSKRLSLHQSGADHPGVCINPFGHFFSKFCFRDRTCQNQSFLQPELLIADEPTTAIDAITQYEILEEFIRIKKQKNTAMLFITHDLGAISRVADRILVMNSGHVVDSGSFDHILKHADDPYTRMLVEKRSAVMQRYRQILHGKEESSHA